MPGNDRKTSDMKIETVIGTLLRVGVLSAAVLVGLGGLLLLIHHGHDVPHYRVFHPEPVGIRQFPAIFVGAITAQPQSLILLGLLVLIATPIARVFVSIFAFWRQGDRAYTLISAIVLVILLYSLAVGR
jgi:uncharacterized membrane protein